MSRMKKADQLTEGDWIDKNDSSPDYPEPADADHYFCRIDRVQTVIDMVRLPEIVVWSRMSDGREMELESYRATEYVWIWTREEVDAAMREGVA